MRDTATYDGLTLDQLTEERVAEITYAGKQVRMVPFETATLLTMFRGRRCRVTTERGTFSAEFRALVHADHEGFWYWGDGPVDGVRIWFSGILEHFCPIRDIREMAVG